MSRPWQEEPYRFRRHRGTAGPPGAARLRYKVLLADIKRRLAVAADALAGEVDRDDVEAAALQLRQVVEAVAIGSLILHSEWITRTAKQLRKLDFAQVCAELRKLNEDYWPHPVMFRPGLEQLREHKPRTEGVLQVSDIGRAHGLTSNWLHARGQWTTPLDIETGANALFELLEQLTFTLSRYLVVLPGREVVLYCMLDERPEGAPAGSGAPWVEAYEAHHTVDAGSPFRRQLPS